MKKTVISFVILALSISVSGANNDNKNRQPADSTVVEALKMIRSDSLFSYMQHLQDFDTRFMLAPNRREIASSIMSKFLSFGFTEVRLDSFLCYTAHAYDTLTWQYNVEARILGSVYPDHEMIIMGHYDSYVEGSIGDNPFLLAPGANDNASGVATLLECARVIMKMGYQPRKTMVFLATAAEELMFSGDSGAKHYAQQASNNNRKLGMIINNDMIAWNNGNWELTMSYPENHVHMSTLAIHVLETYTTLNHTYSNFGTFADLSPFIDLGYHGIYFMESFSPSFYPYYHSIFDVVDHLDSLYHAEITKVNLAMLMHYDLINIDAAITEIFDIPTDNCTGSVFPSIVIANFGSDTITSLNIVCMINKKDSLVLPWTGSLAFLDSQLVKLPEIPFHLLNENELVITLENINNKQDQCMSNNTMSYTFGKALPTPKEVKLRIRLDANPHETTWSIKDASEKTVYSGGPYANPNHLINKTMTLDEGCYIFTIYDEGGDGFNAPGHFLLYYGSNNKIFSGIDFGYKAQTQFDVGNTLSNSNIETSEYINFYPNPIKKKGVIEFEIINETMVKASIYNLIGIKVDDIINQVFEPGFHRVTFNSEDLKTGLYIISLNLEDKMVTKKLIKQ